MEQNKKEEQKFKCSGDCTQCIRVQREYCAAQNAYYCMRMLQAMQGTVEELKAQIKAIQDNEADIFIPSVDNVVEIPIAQEGDGE